MSEQLTELEQRVYHYMIDFLAANTYQPSIRDIARQFHIKSTKTVSDLLHALERKGYIERDESRSRGVRLLGFSGGGQTQPIPFYGRIHAGTPSIAEDSSPSIAASCRRTMCIF
jgi:repressor LexA